MTTWQPIETAPKDGARVLLWTTTEGDAVLTEYLIDVGAENPIRTAQVGFYCDESGQWQLEVVGNPTHWMPLPDPPQ